MVDTANSALEIVRRHHCRPDALLEILHDLQELLGHIPDEAVVTVADSLNLSRADVHGVLSFYHDFRRKPPGRHVFKLCRSEACQAMGCEALASRAEQRSGTAWGSTAGDKHLTLESVYCLGNCALAPAAMLDGKLIGRLDRARLDALLDDCREDSR